MLLTFLYHRAYGNKYSNSAKMLEKQWEYFAQNYPIITPGDKISKTQIQICLTFDDAYFDFYYYVYPLLQKFNIKAVLGVPVGFILPQTSIPAKTRLDIPYSQAMKGDFYQTKAPFCTWEEIKEMDKSGLVHIASHSYTHANLLDPSIDLEHEIVHSKELLEQQLHKEIDTFIYPLGKFNHAIHAYVKKHYKYAMRIGSSWNLSWNNFSGLTYRIISDNIQSVDEHLKPQRFISYLWFYLVNSLRKR